MTEALLLGAVAAVLIGALGLIGYGSRRARRSDGAETSIVGLIDGSLTTDHSHISHSHVDCSAHSVDCGGHGGH